MLGIKKIITILPSQRWSFKINYFIVCWLIKTKLQLDIHTLSFWSFTVSFKSIFKKKIRKTKGIKIDFKSHILTFASSWWGDLSWPGPNVINYRVLKPWHSEKEQKHSSLTCYYQHKKKCYFKNNWNKNLSTSTENNWLMFNLFKAFEYYRKCSLQA